MRPPHSVLIAALALVAVAATPARAGDAVKLAVEFPDLRNVEPGADLDVVQVVGIDAAGARVGFGGRRVRLTASAGSTRVIEAPFRFGYTAPETIDAPTAVTFTATLEGAPSVRGTARLDVLPKGPYVRLSVRTDDRVEWGESTLVTVKGENRAGRLVPVVKGKVEFTVDGPGTIAFVRLGTYRFTAPATPGATDQTEARLVARIAGRPAVHGSTAIALGGPGIQLPLTTATAPTAGTAPTPDSGASGKPGDAPSTTSGRKSDAETSGEVAGNDAGTKNAGGKTEGTGKGGGRKGRGKKRKGRKGDSPAPADGAAADAAQPDPGEAEPVRWPGGALGVLAWRGRPDGKKGTPMRRVRRLPDAGGEFVLRDVEQRVRALVLADGASDVRAEWRTGDERSPIATPLGRVRTVRDRLARLVVVLDATPPATGEPLRVTIIVTTPTGEVRDDLVLRRRTGGGGKKDGGGAQGGDDPTKDAADESGKKRGKND